jgi:ABC-type sugar transport system ATPase subunit
VTGSALLSAEGVGKRYGASVVLEDVSLEVPAGEIHAIVGENGAGKSTLLGIMAGLIRPDSGELRLGGKATGARGIRRGTDVAMVQQELALCGDRSVAENVFLGSEPRRLGALVRRREMDLVTKDVLARLGVTLPPRAGVAALTPAERQLTEVARAVRQDAPLLLLDEPTSSLNLAESESLLALLRRLRDMGHGIVLVSQRLPEVMQVADRITVLRDGRVVARKDAAATSVEEVARLMVGRDLPEPEARDERLSGKVVLDVRDLQSDVLEDLFLQVREGEIVGIAGLDGAGRTELLETIFGLRKASGTVQVHGEEVSTVQGALRAGVAYVGPDRRSELFLERSLQDNVAAVRLGTRRRLRFLRFDALRRAAVSAIKAAHVVPARPQAPAGSLSGGNQQKLLVGRWLTRDVKLWLLSEPTRGVDIGAKAEIYQSIEELARQGATFCISSSELPELLLLASRIVVMHDGRVVGELDRERASEERVMELIYEFGQVSE